MINKFCIYIVFFVLASCQLPPTKVSERHESSHPLFVKLDQPIVISKDVVVLDARAFFNYSMFHIQDSYFIRWQDYLVANNSKKLLPEQTIARKLRLKNIHPKSSHLIIGSVKSPDSAALAWLLTELGVEDVQTIDFSYFKTGLTTKTTLTKNAKNWQAKNISSEFVQKIDKSDILIDVRPESVSFKLPLTSSKINQNQIINIPWSDFYNSYGRPEKSVVLKLNSIKINKNKSIVLTSYHLNELAAASYALKILGFKNVKIWIVD